MDVAMDIDLPDQLVQFANRQVLLDRFSDIPAVVVEAVNQFRLREEPLKRPTIDRLWRSPDEGEWNDALRCYWAYVRPENLEIERRLRDLQLNELARMNPPQWFAFLHDEYFPWKYTDARRLATTRPHLVRAADRTRGRDDLDGIRRKLLEIDPSDTATALKVAQSIPGLGVAGASGLLSLLYPDYFATVDQFVVKALLAVNEREYHAALRLMTPESLSLQHAVALIRILADQAAVLNRRFGTATWTPRRVDMVLWTYGR